MTVRRAFVVVVVAVVFASRQAHLEWRGETGGVLALSLVVDTRIVSRTLRRLLFARGR